MCSSLWKASYTVDYFAPAMCELVLILPFFWSPPHSSQIRLPFSVPQRHFIRQKTKQTKSSCHWYRFLGSLSKLSTLPHPLHQKCSWLKTSTIWWMAMQLNCVTNIISHETQIRFPQTPPLTALDWTFIRFQPKIRSKLLQGLVMICKGPWVMSL